MVCVVLSFMNVCVAESDNVPNTHNFPDIPQDILWNTTNGPDSSDHWQIHHNRVVVMS